MLTGDSADIERDYRALLEQEPDNIQALGELGALVGAAGRHDEAVQYLQRACALEPGNPLVLHNFGESLRQLGQLGDAETVFRKALSIDSSFAPAYGSLSEIALVMHAQARQRQDPHESNRLAEEFTALAIAHGNLLLDSGYALEAIAAFRRVLQMAPDHANAWSNLGNALRVVGQVTEAEFACRKALALNNGFPEAWNNLGNALVEQGRMNEAAGCFDTALSLRPDFPEARHNAGSGSLFNLLYQPDVTPQQIEIRHRQWGEAYPVSSGVAFEARPSRAARLRIGYLSADFRQHAMLHFIEPILAGHDTENCEIVCYAQGPAKDAHTQRLMSYGHRWVWIHALDDAALARRIAADGIDVLIDCVGHTHGTRLRALAVKPAPVMLSWLGYLAPTGLPAMDYRLTDEWVDPSVRKTPAVLEQPLHVPGGMMAYRPHQHYPEVSAAPSFAKGHVTFGSLNNIQKFNSGVAITWAAIMGQLPNSRLLMQSRFFADMATVGRVRGMFEVCGIASERLDLRPYAANFLDTYADIDIALDTFPYGGGATTCDALWMGVPVITLAGDRPSGRLSTSILNQIGYAEWTAPSRKSYIQTACNLARDVDLRLRIRTNLRSEMQASVLCDEAGFVRRLEKVYASVAKV